MKRGEKTSAKRKAADFNPGFRLSWLDVFVLAAGGMCSFILHGMDAILSMVVFCTVTHFFLFCNVLRMRRAYELIWAVVFVVLAVLNRVVHVPPWPVAVLLVLSVTAVLAVIELRQPSYHGICWQQINPNLPRWWAERHRGEL